MDKWPSFIKNIRAASWLLVLIAGVIVSYRMFDEAVTERPFDSPPWLAVSVAFIAVIALFLNRQEAEELDDDEEVGRKKYPRLFTHWITAAEPYWRPATLLLSILFTLFVLYRIPTMTVEQRFTSLLMLWLFAIGLYLLAASPRLRSWTWDWQSWWGTHRREIIQVSGVVLFALLLRVWQLDTIPFTLGGDEGSQGLEAIRVLEGEILNPFATGWLGVPTMSFFFNSLTIKLLGQTIVGLRLPWALVGAASVFISFLLVKRLKNTRFAFVIALLLAAYHYHIHFSRLGSNQVADPFFMVLSLFFLYRALDENRWLDWALAGCVAGLAFYFYAGARLTGIVLLTVIIYEFIRRPRQFWQQHRLGLVVMVGGFLIAGAPIIQYALRFPSEFNARINVVGIFQSGWLEREVVIRQESSTTILFDQFRRAALAFNYYRDRTVWYGLRQPLLDPFFGVLFLLGLGLGTLRLFGKTADPRSASMVAWWWGGMLLGGMLTESPPSSQRLITLSIPACYFIGLALWEVVQLMKKSFRGISVNTWLAVGVLLFSFVSLHTYFVDYTPQRLYGGPHAELATEIAPQLRELAPNHRIYFVGPPIMYWGFATLPYLVPNAEGIDITENFTNPLAWDSVSLDKGAVFVILPDRQNELALIQHSLPEGEIFNYLSPINQQQMVTLYVVPKATTFALPTN